MSSQPQVDLIGPELLEAARRGDTNHLLARGDTALWGVTKGGNTALHIAAIHGHLGFAEMIYQRESSLWTLLMVRNVMRETPLHCAARAGHHQIVKSIISFAERNRINTVLRERNRAGETALHEAARNGHVEVAKLLMGADRELANMVDEEGISPLYLAAMAGSYRLICAILPPRPSTTTEPPPSTTTAPPPPTPPSTTTAPPPPTPPSTTTSAPPSTTTAAPPFLVSYAGPNGQTPLHVAAFRQNTKIAQELLKWNKMLAKVADKSGSTPLHFAASAGNDEIVELLLKDDSSLAYISDSDGLFPVHAAAITGEVKIIEELIKQCPYSDELLDKKERNFLHTAVEHTSRGIVRYVCERSELVKLMNARDYEGNTPLHLAVTKGDEGIVSLLVRNKTVNLSIMNNKGLTPRDLSIIKRDRGLHYLKNPSQSIYVCLAWLGAIRSPRRLDHFERDDLIPVDIEKERKKHAQVTRSLVIPSVLIATVTFSAAFTLPGGYRADGTPNLARRYVFKAFVIADTFAFIFSLLSTISSIFGGSQLVHHRLSLHYVFSASSLLAMASTSFVAAFALAIYLVLAPVNKYIAILVFVITSSSLLIASTPDIIHICNHAITVKSRLGWTGLLKNNKYWWMPNIAVIICQSMLSALLIYILIFLLALH